MDEVQKQMNDLSSKQKEKIEELNAEIRKLKAMIVKHETRIRFGQLKIICSFSNSLINTSNLRTQK